MSRTISDAVRELCLGLPEVREARSHGMTEFRVGNRGFVSYAINHHGDGRVALWLRMPPGAQQMHVEAAPRQCFVPPYVGPQGWLGVCLDQGVSWRRIGALVREAYTFSAPRDLTAGMGAPADVAPPDAGMDPEELDPLSPPRIRQIVDGLRQRCLGLPEVTETTQFGQPAWRAGKKVFCLAQRYDRRLELLFRVAPGQQSSLTLDPRFRIPAYLGRHGWVALEAEQGVRWDEAEGLMIESYRHFALKRMLKALEARGA